MHTFKHYTKKEVKMIKDMSLTDEDVSKAIGRTKQAIYCKRWMMRLKGSGKSDRKRKVVKEPTNPQVSMVVDDIVNAVAANTIKNTDTSVERVVLGNVTIDLVSKTLTIKF
jgi:hypothetical protein